MSSMLQLLKAARARRDGLSWDAAGNLVFITTRTSGPWTDDQKAAVYAALKRPVPAPPTPDFICGQIDAFRDKHLAAGFPDTGPGGTGKTWECDDVSQKNWTALAALAQPWALGLTSATPAPSFAPWGTDNEPVALTAAEAYQLFAVRIAAWVQAVMDYARAMKTAVRAGNPPADITAGWP